MSIDFARMQEIFLAALERHPDDRDAYLDHACADDELRQQVKVLLRAHIQAGSVPGIADEPDQTGQFQTAGEPPGTVIGQYKLIEQIGEGGMGTVWMAHQAEPVKRVVALKLIKAGMDSKQVIARFGAERQALALMEHPNIARVLDGGTTSAGRPYFVMDLVKGLPITRYCDEHHLTPRQRLELFIPVCQAIQHAHQKGIIHRDLKPSNVLVALYDGRPVPKVIDFGIAKATGQPLTEQTLVTGFGAIVGTLEYMSPEQAEINQLDIDTRSDIYSLGVLLYELLTGTTPVEHKRVKESGLVEALRIIREEEVPTLSKRLSSTAELPAIATNRGTEPAKLTKLVRGELDWIVMKALEKDRSRRYGTANGFAMDVQRYLADEPVQACPPSVGYRFRKFARRNKGALATMTLISLMLLVAVGAIAGSFGWVTRDRADRRLRVEQAVTEALERADALQIQSKWHEALVAVEEAEAALLTGEASEQLHQRVRDQRTDLNMVQRLDELRSRWGDHPGHENQDRAYAQVFADFGIDVSNLSSAGIAARILHRPGVAVRVAAGLDEWAMILRDWSVQPERKQDPSSWKRLVEAARQVDPDPWRRELRQMMIREDINGLRKLADSSDVSTLPVQSLQLMGNALIFGGDAPACIAWLRKAHRRHPGDTLICFDLAFHLSNLPNPDRAEVLRFAEAALAARPQSASMHNMVGSSLDGLGRSDEAIVYYRRALELKPDNATAHSHLGHALSRQGKPDEAIHCFRKALELMPDSPEAYCTLGVALTDNGRVDEAIAAFRKAIELKPDHAWAYIHLGISLNRKDRLDEAIAAFRKAIELKSDEPWAHSGLGWALGQKGRHDEAAAACRRAIELKPDFAWPHRGLGMALYRQGKVDEAVVPLRKAVELNPKYSGALNDLGNALENQKKFDDAVAAYRRAIELDPRTAMFHRNLGWVLRAQGKLDEAVVSYRTAIKLDPKNARAHNNLGLALYSQKKLDEAGGEYRTAIELDTNNAGAHINLGNVLYYQKKLDEAIAEYRKAIEIDANIALAHSHLGHALCSQENWDEAIACFRKVIELDPNDALAHHNLGIALFNQCGPQEWLTRKVIDANPNLAAKLPKLAEAAASFKKAIELNPKHVESYVPLGEVLRYQGQFDEAIDTFQKAIDLTPKDAQPWYERGLVYRDLQQPDKARADYAKVIELQPDHKDAWTQRHETYQGQLDRALADYTKDIERKPDNAVAWHFRGAAYWGLEQLDMALADFTKAIELKPGDEILWAVRAGTHARLGQPEKAIADYSKAIELKPDYRLALIRRSQINESLKQWDKVIADKTKLLQLNPAWSGNDLAWLLATCPDPKYRDASRAIELAKKAVELAPEEGTFWNTLGVSHYRNGNWKAAIEALKRSDELVKDNYFSFNAFFLALAHWQLGDQAEARTWFDKAVEWMDANAKDNAELIRFRAEAEELIKKEK